MTSLRDRSWDGRGRQTKAAAMETHSKLGQGEPDRGPAPHRGRWVRPVGSPSKRCGGTNYEVRVEHSVGGLLKGSGVTLQGVPVGLISEIRLDSENPGCVIVRFVLTQDTVLRRGVKASIDRSLLNGSAKLSLSGGTNRDPALAALPGQPFPIMRRRAVGSWVTDLRTRSPRCYRTREACRRGTILRICDRSGNISTTSRAARKLGRAVRIVEHVTRTDRIGALGDQTPKVGSGAEHLRRRIEYFRDRFRDNIKRRLNAADHTAVPRGESSALARPRLKQLDDDARHVTTTVRSVCEPVRRVRDAATGIGQERSGSTKLRLCPLLFGRERL